MKKWQAGIFITAIVGVFAGSGFAFANSVKFDQVFKSAGGKSYVDVDCYTSDSLAGSVKLEQGGQDISGKGVESGVRVTLKATPADGYVFIGWYRLDNGEPLLDENNKPVVSETYTINAYSTKLEARFRAVNAVVDMKTISIVSEQLGGVIVGKAQGGGQYVLGTDATVVATPFYGYEFAGWYIGNDKVSDNGTYTFEVEGDTELTAKWAVKKYAIEVAHEVDGEASVAGVAGSIEGAPTDPVVHGASVDLLAQPNKGFAFDGWYDGTNCLSKEAKFQFTATKQYNLTAKWKEIKYTVSITKNDNEAGDVTGAGTYKEGEDVTLIATENKGYKFLGWYEGDKAVPLSEDLTYVIEDIAANKDIQARWEVSISEYLVSVEKNIESAGTATGGGLKVEGDSVTLTATCNEGFRFVGWFVGGNNVCANEEYTFDVTEEVTVTATWEVITYTIDVTVDPDSVGTVEGGGVFEYGSQVRLVATTTSNGYTFSGWYEGDTLVWSEATFAFVPESDRQLTAKWAVNTYTVVVNKNIGTAGDITGSGDYAYGSTATLEAATNPGYQFLGWFLDDSDTAETTETTYSFTVSDVTTITAKWKVVAYNVTIVNSNESAGSVTGGGLVDIDPDTNLADAIILSATANEGYEFVGWFDGALLLSEDVNFEYTPTGNITITAQWQLSSTAAFDPDLVEEITGHVATINNVELGTRQSIPIVYVTYGGQKIRAFPYVTCEGEKVDVGSRGTKFLVSQPKTHIIQYYIEVGGKACAIDATTTVYVVDTSGPTFNLPASADGMLVYKNQVVTLPDWTAVDPSGVDGDVEVSITYGGSAVSFDRATRTFTPTQIGNYVVTYVARDTVGNITNETFTIECKLMVELCDFDSEDVGAAYAYNSKTSTYGELSTDFRYGDDGYSLKFSGVGTGADGIIKAYAIPMYYDLSGFDEIALYVWSDQALTGVSAGIYLLNNEGYSEVPINLAAGENIVKFDKAGFQASYPGGTIPSISDEMRVEYRNEDYVWFQFRAPEGCNIYIDNLVGIFNDYGSTDSVNPVVDLGAGYMIAQTMANDTLYAGEYGNMTCWTGEALIDAIERNVRGYDNSADAVTIDYTVKNASGVDVTEQVKAGTLLGVAAGEEYTITAWATDTSGNVSTSKTGIIRVRNKPIEHTMDGHESRRLSAFNSLDVLVGDNNLDVSIDVKVNKDGRVRIKTKDLWEEFTVELKLQGEILTTDMINAMKYINLNIFSYNSAAEFYVNDTLITRIKGGWNNVAFDAQMLLESGAYDTSTGMLRLQVYSPLDNTMELVFEKAEAIYNAGSAPEGEDLEVLKTPVVTIDGTTGIASWEAIPNATAYIYTINGGDEVEIPTTQLSVQLSDGDEFRVRAKGDGETYEDSAMSSNQLYLDGADLLNDCEQEGYGIFEVNSAVTTLSTSTEHVKEGSKSVKAVFSQDSYFVVILTKGSNPVSLEDLADYEYIEFSVYSDTAGVQFLFGGNGSATWYNPGIVVGDNVIRLTREFLLEQINLYGTLVYNPEMGALTMNTSQGCTMYFDKFIGKIDPNADMTQLSAPTVTVDETGLASWSAISNATGYAYTINGGTEQTTTETSVQLSNIGDTIQVKAIGDNENYLDSAYSTLQTYLDPEDAEVVLNDCESVGGWVQAINTPTLSTENVFEGTYSIEVTFGGWSWFNVRLFETAISLEELQATYETITFNVYSSIDGLNIYRADQATVAGLLSSGDNVITLNTADLTSTDFNGEFLTFYAGGASTIRIDNVVGVKQTSSSLTTLSTPVVTISDTGLASWTAVSGAVGYICTIDSVAQEQISDTSVQLSEGQTIQVQAVGDGTTYSNSNNSTLLTYTSVASSDVVLNTCESVGGWVQAINTPTLSTENVFEGTYSIEVTFGGWSWFNVRLFETAISLEELQATYETITFNVYSSIDGLNIYRADQATVVSMLSAGNNVITLNTADLTSTDFNGEFLTFYAGGASTIRIDNVVGTPKA